MSQPAAVTSAFLDKILTLLAPLFLTAAGGKLEVARDAVRSTLTCYNARTDEELRLAALIVAFSFGALDALSQAASPDLSLNQILRLRGNAVALSRASNKNEAALDQLHEQDPAAEAEPAEPELPASIETPALVAFARTAAAPRTQAAEAPMTRQQRRAAERAAEKAKRQQDYQARRAASLN